jgi:hypothetical protein
MIGWLRYGKTANFYKRRARLSKAAINNVFNTLRGDSAAPSNNVFRHVKERLHGAYWSAISFFYDRDPSFLILPAAHARERVCGFLLLVEYRDHAVIFKAHIDLPTEFKTRYLNRIADDRVDAVIARADAAFEKMSFRTMAASPHALRSKILEADNLEVVVSPMGGNRYIRRGYRVRRGAEHLSTVPNTGRISLRSERVDHRELVSWAVGTIDALIDEHRPPSAFIRQFATSIDLASLPTTVEPRHIGFDADGLADNLFEVPDPVRLVRFVDGDAVPLTEDETKAVVGALRRTFPIRKVKKELRIIDPDTNAAIGTIFIGKTAITLHRFDPPTIGDVYVQSVAALPGEAGRKVSLKTYINHNDLLTVLFSDLSIVYLNGGLYRDEALVRGGGALMKYVVANALLNNAVDEKGNFVPAQTEFDPDTLFRAIVDSIAAGDDILVCDDLGDEWADFVGVGRHSQPKRISFYHAKHEDDTSLGAGPLHIVVSQAIKNLGRMALSDEQIARKQATWHALYPGTAIPRIVRGDAGALTQDISVANSAPDTIRRVFIVVSSLSRRQLENAFAAITAGTSPAPYFVQLYWLLMSYIAACVEVGAFPYVVCRE